MTATEHITFEWKKTKVSNELKSKMESATAVLGDMTGQRQHLVTHLFGRMLTFEMNGLIFFWASNRSRPSRFTIIAVAVVDSYRPLMPSLQQTDFEECCRILGIEEDENRFRLEAFVNPKRPSTDRRRSR